MSNATRYSLPDNDPTPEQDRDAVLTARVKFAALVANAQIQTWMSSIRTVNAETGTNVDLHFTEKANVERAIIRMLDGFLVVEGPPRCPNTVTDDDGDEIARCVYGANHEGKCGF